jgi:hypothetical protein
MKRILLILAVFYSNFCTAQKPGSTSDSAKFFRSVRQNSSAFTFDGQRPGGRGWEILEKQFADNQFVAWGEYHNSALLSQLSGYALQAAGGFGFKNWCVEVSPFVAAELTAIAHSPSPFDTLKALSKDHPDYGVFPFFKTKADAELITTAAKYKFNIWGIDQEFQMAFPYCISKVYNAQSPKIRSAYKGVYDSLMAKWWMPKVSLLDSLMKVTVQQKLKQALSDVKLSRAIYYEQDNQLRASLMKKNFYQYYDDAKAGNKKVFFKMGANHLAKGLNLMTNLYDIGNAAYELAQRNKTGFVNVYFINRYYTEKGKVIDDLESEEGEYPKEFLQLYDKDKWIVVDLRALRLTYNHDKTLTDDTYQIIYKYDFVVVSPEVMQ